MVAEDDPGLRRRRLRYRAWHRGTREMDLVLGPFADALPDDEIERLEKLMAEEDADLTRWLLGHEEPPTRIDRELLRRIAAFRATTLRPT